MPTPAISGLGAPAAPERRRFPLAWLRRHAAGGYLEAVDRFLARGAASLTPAFAERQVAFVAACQQPDGGFPGRRGPSDAYYTDFALRTLALLAPAHSSIARAAGYVSQLVDPPPSLVECFCRLNAARICRLRGAGTPEAAAASARAMALEALDRRPVNVYDAFLAALCLELAAGQTGRQSLLRRLGRAVIPGTRLGSERRAVAAAARHVARLQDVGGGFSTRPEEGVVQANATAAAVALLRMGGQLCPDLAGAAARFLAGLQAPDGGLRAHPAAPAGDLLSTFTGLLTLFGLGAAGALDLAGVARFVRSAACPGGGFCAGPGDPEPDLEYTYYGVGALALLRLIAERPRSPGR